MGKMYTLDKKLLVGSPEIRIGDKCYPVDDRTSTVRKAMKLFKTGDKEDLDNLDEIIKLAFGKNSKEILDMDMPFSAYQKLVEMAIELITTGEIAEDGFQAEDGDSTAGAVV